MAYLDERAAVDRRSVRSCAVLLHRKSGTADKLTSRREYEVGKVSIIYQNRSRLPGRALSPRTTCPLGSSWPPPWSNSDPLRTD